MTTTDTLTPTQIDTELARIWADEQIKTTRLRNEEASLARYGTTWRRTEIEQAITAYRSTLANLRAEADPYEAEYLARGGWNRYFLVANANGHVHRGMSCSTCFADTQYRWLIELADCDEQTMVEEWGERACTVCFPDAPTNPAYNRPARADREAAEQRAAEKATRVTDKAAKAITGPDGGPLRVPSTFSPDRTDLVATKVAARNELSQAVQDFGWYGAETYRVRAVALIEALERHGIDTAPVIARATAKVAKEGGEYSW